MFANPTLLFTFIFLLICFFAGLYTSKGKQNFRSFAVGDKDFSTLSLMATMIATCFGGSFLFRDLTETYLHGMYYSLYKCFCFTNTFIVSKFFAPRMGEFLVDCSVGESMGKLFGRTVRKVTAISGILFCACILAMQLTVIEKVIQSYCKIEGPLVTGAIVVIVLVYSVLGGIKAVTLTDAIQFFTFIALFPMLICLIGFVGRGLSDFKAITNLLTTHPNFDLRQVFKCTPKFLNTLLLIFPVLLPTLQPASVQRIYMAKDTKDVRTLFFYTGIVGTLLNFFVVILGIILLSQAPDLDASQLVDYMLNLHSYWWIKPLFCIGILALAMSTADSNLHMAAIFFTHDLCEMHSGNENKINYTRLSMVLTTLIALCLPFYSRDLFKMFIVTFSFYIPIVTVPFLMANLGFRPRSASVLLAMSGGASVVIAFYTGLGKYFGVVSPVFIGMVVNFIILMGSYYLLPTPPGTGWVGIQDKTPLILANQERARKQRLRQAWH